MEARYDGSISLGEQYCLKTFFFLFGTEPTPFSKYTLSLRSAGEAAGVVNLGGKRGTWSGVCFPVVVVSLP